jgi:YHS domain-containing protein
MKTQTKTMTGMLAALLAATALSFTGCKKEEPEAYHADGHEVHAMHAHKGDAPHTGNMEMPARLSPIAADRVCMVNDQVFPTPQIPVEVDGRTYYGCCEGCKATLANDRRARVAVDPLTGQEVDKATASIGAFPDGRVLYFASDAHRDAYDPTRTN